MKDQLGREISVGDTVTINARNRDDDIYAVRIGTVIRIYFSQMNGWTAEVKWSNKAFNEVTGVSCDILLLEKGSECNDQ